MNRLRAGRPRHLFSVPCREADFFLKILSNHFFLVSTKHPIQCVKGAHFLAVIGCGMRVIGHLPPSTKVKSSWRYTRSYSCVLMECCLIKERETTLHICFITSPLHADECTFSCFIHTEEPTHRPFLTFDCCHVFCTREPTHTAMQETTFNPFALQAFVRNKQVTSLTVLKE
jgi:hypothetical protein